MAQIEQTENAVLRFSLRFTAIREIWGQLVDCKLQPGQKLGAEIEIGKTKLTDPRAVEQTTGGSDVEGEKGGRDETDSAGYGSGQIFWGQLRLYAR